MSTANSYFITVQKPTKYKDPFFTGNIKNTNEAFQRLSKSGFGLYIWFLQNKSGYSFELYSVQAQQDLGISSRTYDNAIKELKDKNYLVYQGRKVGTHPIYYFYDEPFATANSF